MKLPSKIVSSCFNISNLRKCLWIFGFWVVIKASAPCRCHNTHISRAGKLVWFSLWSPTSILQICCSLVSIKLSTFKIHIQNYLEVLDTTVLFFSLHPNKNIGFPSHCVTCHCVITVFSRPLRQKWTLSIQEMVFSPRELGMTEWLVSSQDGPIGVYNAPQWRNVW